MTKVEQSVIDKGGAGRFGTWAYSYGFTVSAGLGEYARRIIDGEAEKGSLTDLSKALGSLLPMHGGRVRTTRMPTPVCVRKIRRWYLWIPIFSEKAFCRQPSKRYRRNT
ncbi:hypothetical protein [Treponema vincentii]|uniref:hypothetical protein n=1 Tax=Treponema vincentii TaxID=69710 RepID=UPI002EDB68CB